MIEWTTSAREELERYFARVRSGLQSSGADVAEVEDDLRRHIAEEAAAGRLKAVTEDDVRRILARMGPPDLHAGHVHRSSSAETTGNSKPPDSGRKPMRLALLVFGVVLPLLALSIELATHMCAGAFFDPIPTWWHVFFVACVPLANLLVWRTVREGIAQYRNRLSWANAFAIGVAAFYALLFLPLLPAATMAVIFFGWGLLPLSTLLAFIAAARLRHQLRGLQTAKSSSRLPGLWRGAGVAFAVMLVIQFPASLTQIGLHMAASDSPSARRRGIRWLRSFGDEQTLQRACYGRTRWAENADLITWLFAGSRSVPATDARNIYYRVTGRAFNSVPPPNIFTARGRWNALEEEFTWDDDQGGEAVAGRVKGLSLVSSREDALIEADAALAYVEWTLEFKNISTLQREARAQILLPPGGVVSRLTLWFNGEEREAAFGGRSQVREAYQKVVTQRRDPVLVTTCGPDCVLVQCFPVPPNGGAMKLRVGVTAPLILTTADEAAFRWPCFLERNFTIPEGFKHVVWAESKQKLEVRGVGLRAENTQAGLAAVRGEVGESDLSLPHNVVRVHRDNAARQAWTTDTRDDAGGTIRQVIVESPSALPQRVVFVIDGSEAMVGYLPAITETLSRLPEGIEFALLIASDLSADAVRVEKGSSAVYERAADKLRRLKAVGGQDNLPALARAWDLAAESNAGAVVWIHGPQPVLLENAEQLKQRLDRRPNSPLFYEVQTEIGPNRVVEKLDGIDAVRPVPRLDSLSDDLKQLIGNWHGQTRTFALARERLGSDLPAASMPGKPASLHLARLWAFDEIHRLVAARQFDKAVRLADRYQLVTPVSGAVVLETKAQYQTADLRPVEPQSVPSVPEPSTWVLLLVGLAVVVAHAARRRKANRYGIPT